MTFIHIVARDGSVIAVPSRFARLCEDGQMSARDLVQIPGAFVVAR